MIMEIGIIAGDIWHYLDEHNEVMLEELVKAVDKSKNEVLMSIGWLAREGHITIEKGNGYKIKLRK